jgi:hypothetical protein
MHRAPDQRVVFAGLLAMAFMTGCASTSSSTASTGWDGLARRQVAGLDEVYVRPDVKFDVYRTVMIDPVQIAFDKNWDPNRSQRDLSLRLSAADIQEIKDDMARNFREVLVEELTAGGYQVVEQASADTMRIAPSLADVYINAPDVLAPGALRAYTLEPGEMTLVLEVRDGPTGQILARVVDEETGHQETYLQVTNAVTNTADFRRAFRAWARQLRAGLDRLSGKSG